MSSTQSRKDEILAKKAKLAELKRQRELRARELSNSRQSIGDTSELALGSPLRHSSSVKREGERVNDIPIRGHHGRGREMNQEMEHEGMDGIGRIGDTGHIFCDIC
jgi:hypothetical protein